MTDSQSDIVDVIRAAGVVGAGGAGFPTHVKASSKAEIVIANGAECEPLLHKDKEILKARSGEVIAGLRLMMRATGAREGVIAVKEKYPEITGLYADLLKGEPGLRVLSLGDYYPAGDEFCLVYEATGRIIPAGGIPIQIGAVVNNIETLVNVARAAEEPVTSTFLTVAGAVENPVTVEMPVGASVGDALDRAGGATVPEFALIDGGAMMGRVSRDLSAPLTKSSGGFIVLPADHKLITRKSAPREVFSRIGRSACDQCTFCTEFCPRYLLGYPVEPHKVMRSLSFTGAHKDIMSEWAVLCCECSLCSLYACPESLDPRNICVAAKGDLRAQGVTWKNAALAAAELRPVHSMREFRKTPISRLIKRLGLEKYAAAAPLSSSGETIDKVRIPLKQHVGAPCEPAVTVGERVSKGQLIGKVPKGQLGAPVHASIDGVVRAVNDCVTIED